MNILVFTNMYPFDAMPFYGSFVCDEVRGLQNAGCDVDVLFINGKANKLSYLVSPFRLGAALRRKRYDIVHVHHSFCGFVALFPKRLPIVWTFHEGEIAGDSVAATRRRPIKALTYSKRLKRFVAGRTDRVIVVAEYLKEPLGRPDATTIPAGVDVELFAPMDRASAIMELGLDAGRRYVLFPSSPSRLEKRYDLAKSAVDRFCSDGANDGIELLCLDNVPHEKVPLYMNVSEVLLMTSEWEASPVTIREALACNLPVVSTDVGDVRLLVEPIDGCFVVEDRIEPIADALSQVFAAGHRIEGRERVKRFSLENTAKQIVDVYRDLIGS